MKHVARSCYWKVPGKYPGECRTVDEILLDEGMVY